MFRQDDGHGITKGANKSGRMLKRSKTDFVGERQLQLQEVFQLVKIDRILYMLWRIHNANNNNTHFKMYIHYIYIVRLNSKDFETK